jgi:hypothetical protein
MPDEKGHADEDLAVEPRRLARLGRGVEMKSGLLNERGIPAQRRVVARQRQSP